MVTLEEIHEQAQQPRYHIDLQVTDGFRVIMCRDSFDSPDEHYMVLGEEKIFVPCNEYYDTEHFSMDRMSITGLELICERFSPRLHDKLLREIHKAHYAEFRGLVVEQEDLSRCSKNASSDYSHWSLLLMFAENSFYNLSKMSDALQSCKMPSPTITRQRNLYQRFLRDLLPIVVASRELATSLAASSYMYENGWIFDKNEWS